MKEIIMDPQVLGAGGVILVGLILLFWAIGKLLNAKAAPAKEVEFELPLPRSGRPLSVVTPEANPFIANVPLMPAPPAPVANRAVLDKVDLIAQRLVDMQMLLNKQLTAPAAMPGAGSAPGGLSPETLDKLIKITGSVVEQVELLQKVATSGNALSEPAAPPEPPMGEPPRTGAL
jgi:hypothetical protein